MWSNVRARRVVLGGIREICEAQVREIATADQKAMRDRLQHLEQTVQGYQAREAAMESRMKAMMDSYEKRFAAMEQRASAAAAVPAFPRLEMPKPPTQYHASSVAGGLEPFEPLQPIPMDATIRARMHRLRKILADHGELPEWQLITLLKYAWGADKRHVEYTYDPETGHRIFHAAGKGHGALIDTASGRPYYLHPHTGERVYAERADVDRSEWSEWLEEAVSVRCQYDSLSDSYTCATRTPDTRTHTHTHQPHTDIRTHRYAHAQWTLLGRPAVG